MTPILYLLDANTLIDAKRDYFQLDRVPEFWDWIRYQGESGRIKIPIEIYEEFEEARRADGTRDELAEWAAQGNIRQALLLDEEADIDYVREATKGGYASDLTDDEILKIGRDPFLISYALKNPGRRKIVTTESPRPSKSRANRKIPDVCKSLGIKYINNFDLLRELDFRTGFSS